MTALDDMETIVGHFDEESDETFEIREDSYFGIQLTMQNIIYQLFKSKNKIYEPDEDTFFI